MIDFTYLECACLTPDHTLRFWHDEDTGQVYVECHLRKVAFWKRLWYAFNYVLGKQSKYGAFEETILDIGSQVKLSRILYH